MGTAASESDFVFNCVIRSTRLTLAEISRVVEMTPDLGMSVDLLQVDPVRRTKASMARWVLSLSQGKGSGDLAVADVGNRLQLLTDMEDASAELQRLGCAIAIECIVYFRTASATVRIPPQIAECAARLGAALEVSVYATQ